MKRFYDGATVEAAEGGYAVLLDGKSLKTPAGAPCVIPCHALAEAIADEWQGQGETIQPEAMHLTRLANFALDSIAGDQAAMVEELTGFGASDLLCYRAPGGSNEPVELVTRQQKAWDSYLDWIEARFGVRPNVTSGIVPVDQPEALLDAYREALEAADVFRLAALHLVTTISGSLILALALLDGHADSDGVWVAARIDETFQAERWGRDDEAEAGAKAREAQLMAAARALQLLRA